MPINMEALETYLRRRVSFPALIDRPPRPHLNNVIVIPCHDEARVTDTLSSISSCSLPRNPVEVIIVINASEKDPPEVVVRNRHTLQEIENFIKEEHRDKIRFFPVFISNLPAKKAGVGLARKIGMDEAVRRFVLTKNTDGIITSLDADTLVDPNYLTTLEDFFMCKPEITGVSIYFEHPVEGTAYTPEVYEAIIQYELHLRYFVNALRFIGYPFAFHTIGSAFAVRADAYVKQGGMNIRQGGEDFYFLRKIIKQGNFADLTETRVIPSPRPGTKVPFGTGPEIQKFLAGKKRDFLTYDPEAFRELVRFFSLIPLLYTQNINPEVIFYRFPLSVQGFLGHVQFIRKIHEILENVSAEKTYLKRFYFWFDTFRVIKYLNYSHAYFFSKKPVTIAVREILSDAGISSLPRASRGLLKILRKLDRNPGKKKLSIY